MPISAPTRWILVGGSGFLGTNLIHALGPSDGEAIIIDRAAPAWTRPGVRCVEQDFREVDSYRHEILPGSVVIHMAASSYPGKAEKIIEADIQDNLIGTVRLMNACADAGAAALIFFSSGGTVYGDATVPPVTETSPTEPKSAYGAMKLACEHYLRVASRLRNFPVAILRIGNPFGKYHHGSGQGAVNVFFELIRRGHSIDIYGDGAQTRDFIYADDVARAVRLVGLGFREGCETYNIGSGEERTLREILDAVLDISRKPADIRWLAERNVDVRRNCLDTSKIRSAYGWVPTVPFHDALRETWNWIQENG